MFRNKREIEQARRFTARIRVQEKWIEAQLAWEFMEEVICDGERLIQQIAENGGGARICTK